VSTSFSYTPCWLRDHQQSFEGPALDQSVEDLKMIIQARFRTVDVSIIDRAAELAAKRHHGQTQSNGDRLKIEHALAVARVTAELGFDPQSVAAALLHDVIEDTGFPLDKLRGMFGSRVANLVDAVSKYQSLTMHQSKADIQLQLLRKVLDSVADSLENLPSAFIKLAERLDHMRFSAQCLPLARSQNLSREVMVGYVPLAERLGVWELKAQLEDLAFMQLNPVGYQQVVQWLKDSAPYTRDCLREAVDNLQDALLDERLDAQVESRLKHVHSTYEKIRRKREKLGDVRDLLGMRIIIGREIDCYRALGAVHSLWKPICEEFDDYISTPKPNGYRSLHTTVISTEDIALEVQIRTPHMHEVAEFGLSAHWRYKGKGNEYDDSLNAKFSILQRQLRHLQHISDEREYIATLRAGLLQDQTHVYAATGELASLPKNATPMDLPDALGAAESCIGATVGAHRVDLNRQLRTDDFVTTHTSGGVRSSRRNGYALPKHA
jgi:guanosine-3',5'-bis(diphosphate) 3'-pyrophosphohydrolase